MVHQYKNNGYNIVLDVNSGSVHVVDDIVYDIIALYENNSEDKIIEELKDKYAVEDIKEACEKRLAVYQEFAPEEMSEEAVLAEVKAVLAALAIDAPSMKDKGKVMKELMPRVKGRADGGMVNKIVGEVLNGEK